MLAYKHVACLSVCLSVSVYDLVYYTEEGIILKNHKPLAMSVYICLSMNGYQTYGQKHSW